MLGTLRQGLLRALETSKRRLSWKKRRIEEQLRRRELLAQAHARLTPTTLPDSRQSQIHVLLGHRTVAECIWVLHSLFTHLGETFPALLHDDGTLSPKDCDILRRFYPGARILLRRDTDAIIYPMLRDAGFWRLEALRQEYRPALKLLDLQFFGNGHRVLYLDTDVLIHRPPNILIEALVRGIEDPTTWYNVDRETWYTWSLDDLHAHTGIRPIPRINTGLFTTPVRDLDWWPRYEEWLAITSPPTSEWTWWHREQTLWAIHFSAIGARPLPEEEYDVAHRHGWKGHDPGMSLKAWDQGREVVSQHYSGAWDYRQLFYEALRESFFT